MQQVLVRRARDWPEAPDADDIEAHGTKVRPFRRVRVSVDPPPQGAELVLDCRQYANDVEVATDTLRFRPERPQEILLTASRTRAVVFTAEPVDASAPPRDLRVSLEVIGERAVVDGHLFLLGAMKSGTSTLYAHLRQHPAIAANRTTKEPSFFANDAVFRGHYDYASQYRFDPDRHRWALDGSTNYSKRSRFPGVPERIAQLPGEKRFLYLMRDPVDRIESHLAHNVAHGRWKLEDLDQYLDECADVSSYSAQLDRYAEVFDDLRERTLLLDFLDVVDDLPNTLRRIEDFLGLEPHDYRFRAPSNVRRSDKGADRVELSEAQVERLWRQLRGEERALADRYGFVPREPWGPSGG